jgi:ATP-dependent Clp protease ATP-binding subunit ClpA
MFERFTDEARQAVVRAQAEARSLGHTWIGTEHLLLGVVSQPDTPGVEALLRLGVTPDAVREILTQVVGSDLGPKDADALRTLGIDLDEVRRRVEASFGPGALQPLPRRRRRGLLGRWRIQDCEPAGRIPFAPRAKKALELALREALALKDNHLGSEHILLGLVRANDNLAIDVLKRLGVARETVRAQVLAARGKAA